MQQKLSVQQLLHFVRSLVVPMYFVNRDIAPPTRVHLQENDAEHSWSVAFLACALAPHIDPKLDIGKISQFAIVHDVVEVYAGDVSALDSQAANAQERKERERAALERVKTEFVHLPWIADTIEEYESFSSDEACFVYAPDKLLPVIYDYLDEGEYIRKIKLTYQEYHYHLAPHREKAQKHPAVGEYYDAVRELLAKRPEYFYQSNKG